MGKYVSKLCCPCFGRDEKKDIETDYITPTTTQSDIEPDTSNLDYTTDDMYDMRNLTHSTLDKYDNSIVYLKLTDPKNKLKSIIDIQANDNDIRLPIWTTETQDVILKVKEKWLNVADDLQPLTNYVINADFSAYSLDTEKGNMRGYYIKIPKIKKKKMEDINDDN